MLLKIFTLLALFAVISVTAFRQHTFTGSRPNVDGNSVWDSGYKYPFLDPSLSWDQRVDDLVGRLTLEELVNQTVSIYTAPTYGIPRLGVNHYNWISECLRGRTGTDGTAFPQALGLAATFSDKLLFDISEAVSYETRAMWNAAHDGGVTSGGLSCFSPVINIMRHPLWGRNQETYGEDPYLSSVFARAFVQGLQGNHPRYVRANAGCKHFDVHGGPENIPVTRFSFDAKVSMSDWRMTFLPAFQACVEAGSYSLMCSYNRLNGIPACAHQQLLTNITRKEWGFQGYVVSDAGAIDNIIHQHKYAKDEPHAAADSLNAGCNLELSSTVFKSIPQAIQNGLMTQQTVVDRVKPLMYTRMRLGEFDPASMNPYNTINESVIQSPQHQALAIKAAQKSFVLLKNTDSTLPLRKSFKKVAVVGPMSNNLEQLYGDYAANVNTKYARTPWQSLRKLANTASHSDGCDDTHCKTYNRSDVINNVKGADLVIICLGTGQAVEAEGNDRADLSLPGQQLGLLQDASATAESSGATVVVLLFNAGPLDVTWAKLSPGVHAILACFFPAQATGTALYKTLLGKDADSVPAGRLPATWPAYLAQVPPITNYTMVGRTYRYYEGTPLYPFGYGLSYTSFSYGQLQVSKTSIKAGETLTVSVTLKNTGAFDADEVVQVYMAWPQSAASAPHLQLVGFQRLLIKSLTSSTTHFTISPQQMALWSDTADKYVIPHGSFMLYAGGQQPKQRTSAPSNVLGAQFTVV